MALPQAQPIKEIEPAAAPATRPRKPSAVIHSSDAHASQRVSRATRSQAGSPARLSDAAAVVEQPPQQVSTLDVRCAVS